jgi:hypothetical protein
MPQTDYSNPEITFPRLEAKISTIDGEMHLLSLWLHEKAGGERKQLLNWEASGSIAETHELISKYAKKHGAEIGPDDITGDM